VLYDKDGDVHYDTISAFIKSLRGSDPDAALYWLAKMVYAGEDPRFIFRRMAILAGDDVGLADPNAINVVVSCWEAFERIGLPEGSFPLAEAALYLATCPKSNSTLAFFDAMQVVEEEREAEVPTHMRDANRDKEGFGHGKGYLYPHAFRDHWVAQQYLPGALQGKLFFQPSDQGYERAIGDQVARRREAQLAAMLEAGAEQEPEALTTGPRNRQRDAWLQRAVSNAGRNLAQVRERLFALAEVQRHHLLLVLGASSGLLTWEALRQAPEGGVWALATDPQEGELLRQQAAALPDLERPAVLLGATHELDYLLRLRGEHDLRFDRVLARNPFGRADPPWSQLASQVRAVLLPDGRFCFAQSVPRRAQRLYALVDWDGAEPDLVARVQSAEEAIYHDPDDPLVNWDVADLESALRTGGLEPQQVHVERHDEQRQLTADHLARWFGEQPTQASRPSYGARLHSAGLTDAELEEVAARYRSQLQSRTVSWASAVVYVVAGPARSAGESDDGQP
jgi:putative ATPase